MTAAIDHQQMTEQELQQHPAALAGELADLTPEAASHLAAMLAPHLLAMRAVTSGTRYEHCGDGEADHGAQSVSPATKIFIAGMLERLSA
jgi:hypothetical protein